MPHHCPRNLSPHSLLGTDNLYVNNNGNGHLIHRADSIHIPLRQPLTPINHHKAARQAAPHSSCECSSPRLLPSWAVIFLLGGRLIPEGKMFNGQNCLVWRRTGLSFLAHHLEPKPSSSHRSSSKPRHVWSASLDRQPGAAQVPHSHWEETHRGPCSSNMHAGDRNELSLEPTWGASSSKNKASRYKTGKQWSLKQKAINSFPPNTAAKAACGR